MRVIAGSLGGRRLVAPAGRDVRPTADRVREALFAILEPVEGARVLDLFAGSGALAIEALSRGAASATLVDRSPTALAAARRNVQALSLTGVEFHRADALAFLRRARARSRQYDLVFIDPPYRLASAFGPRLSEPLMPVLAVGARVVFESGRRAPAELALPLLDERSYGETLIRIHGTRQPHRDLPGDL